MTAARFSRADCRFMARALRLAERGLCSTRPNPAVGCVIVRAGQVVGEGWHARAGGPHAEVVALEQAGEAARGATAYVTLEPCSHWGRTPPCASALVNAGIRRVVVAMSDPNPQVAGQGIMLLRSHGIQVDLGLMTDDAVALNRGFIRAMTEGLPYVRLKVATTLDGCIAAANGESRWITDASARQMGHRLRARHGALITGIGTVLADDPAMNVRLPEAQTQRCGLDETLAHPLRVVLDSRLRMPPDARMLTLPGRTLVVCSEQAPPSARAALMAAGAEVWSAPADPDGGLSLSALLRHLVAQYQIRDVLVEAGPRLSGAFITAGLVDELHWFRAPSLLGASGRGAFQLPWLQTLAQRVDWRRAAYRSLGETLYEIYHRRS